MMSQYIVTQSKVASFPAPAFASEMVTEHDSFQWPALLQDFEAIHLSKMGRAALLRRTDKVPSERGSVISGAGASGGTLSDARDRWTAVT